MVEDRQKMKASSISLEIEFFGSLQSPYCYFSLDRLEDMMRDLKVQVVLRLVLPGVIRMPDTYADCSQMELSYFEQDVARTADFLSLPYGGPSPSPVNWIEGEGWVAGPEQGRICCLYNMLYQAHLRSKGYQLYEALMRLIWSGQIAGWDEEPHLRQCLSLCDLPDSLIDQQDVLTPEAENYFASNQQAMFECGHWGVPLFSWGGEPFYGQDRLDQLRWRIEKSL